jgi:hypothetical protein
VNELAFKHGLPLIAMPTIYVHEAERALVASKAKQNLINQPTLNVQGRLLVHLKTYEQFEQEVKSAYDSALQHHKSGRINEAVEDYERALAFRFTEGIQNPDTAANHTTAAKAKSPQVLEINLPKKSNEDQLSSMGLGSIHINLGVAYLAQCRFFRAVEEYSTTLLLTNFTNVKAKFNLAIAFSKMSSTFLRCIEKDPPTLLHEISEEQKACNWICFGSSPKQAVSFHLLLASRFWFVECLHSQTLDTRDVRAFRQKCIGGLHETGRNFRRLHLKTTQSTTNLLSWDIQLVFEYVNHLYDACKTIWKDLHGDDVYSLVQYSLVTKKLERDVLVPILNEIEWEELQRTANLTPRFESLLKKGMALKDTLAAEAHNEPSKENKSAHVPSKNQPQTFSDANQLITPQHPVGFIGDHERMVSEARPCAVSQTVSETVPKMGHTVEKSRDDDDSGVDPTDSKYQELLPEEFNPLKTLEQENLIYPSTPQQAWGTSRWLKNLFKTAGLRECVHIISDFTRTQLLAMSEEMGPSINRHASQNRVIKAFVRLYSGGAAFQSRMRIEDDALDSIKHVYAFVTIDLQVLEDSMDITIFSWRLRVSILPPEPSTLMFRKGAGDMFLSPDYLLGLKDPFESSAVQTILDSIVVNKKPVDILHPKERNPVSNVVTPLIGYRQELSSFEAAKDGAQRIKKMERSIYSLPLKLFKDEQTSETSSNPILPFSLHICRVFVAISEPQYDPYADNPCWKVTVSMDLKQLGPCQRRSGDEIKSVADFVQASAFMSDIDVTKIQLTLDLRGDSLYSSTVGCALGVNPYVFSIGYT